MYQAILLAAGNSSRSGLNYNKVLYTLDDKPLIYISALNFINDERCNKIFLVCKEEELDIFKKIFNQKSKIEYVIGGKTRQESVSNALIHVDDEYVLIHDGARPYYSSKLVNNIVEKLDSFNAVIPAMKVTDTIKVVENGIVIKTVDREMLRAIQTPQGFKTSVIKLAHSLADKKNYTDDSSMVEELTNEKVCVIDGEKDNIKYTQKEDF